VTEAHACTFGRCSATSLTLALPPRTPKGPSGSGKTTLLNALACRLDKDAKMTGELRLNGQKYNMHDLKQHAGYVMQDDLLNGNLTVLETLRYTAELRLPRTMSRAERNERIQTVLQQMGLVKVQDVIIGSPLKKGVSGGERKRLCVAMELLTKPLLLFLDGAFAARCSDPAARCTLQRSAAALQPMQLRSAMHARSCDDMR
jgi:ATP-binding cassette subfamily G (WHITE) protein 2